MTALSLPRRRGKDPAPVNPFLPVDPPQAPAPEEMPADPLLGEALAAVGPSRPLGIDAPAGASLTRAFVESDPRVQLVGLHGGAGTSTLAGLLGDDRVADAGTKVPMGGTPRVLFVARTHAAGLAAVQEASQVWAAQQLSDVDVVGLVLVDDGPRIGKEQLAACRKVMRILPRTWRIGWVEPWRTQTSPDPAAAPRRTRATLRELRTIAAPAATSTCVITSTEGNNL